MQATEIATKHHAAYKSAMITGPQIRAARALLGWTSDRLAQEAGVSYALVSRAEQFDGVPSTRADNLSRIQIALESAGVLFLYNGDTRDGGPGVRLRP